MYSIFALSCLLLAQGMHQLEDNPFPRRLPEHDYGYITLEGNQIKTPEETPSPTLPSSSMYSYTGSSLPTGSFQATNFGNPDTHVTVILGATGSGKSLLASLLAGNTQVPLFPVSALATSETYQTKQELIKWLGKEDAEECVVVDTPGLGDGDGSDTQHIANMVRTIRAVDKHYKGVNRFLIVFNSEDARFSDQLKDILLTFESTFTGEEHPLEEWINHVSFVFTKWCFDDKPSLRRRRAGNFDTDQQAEDTKRSEYSQKLLDHFMQTVQGFQPRLPVDPVTGQSSIPCYFLDSLDAGDCLPNGRHELAEEDAEKRYFVELERLRNEIHSSSKFPCSDMTAGLCSKDAVQLQLAKKEDELKEAEARAAWNDAKWPVAITGGGAATAAGTYVAMHEPFTCITVSLFGFFSLTQPKGRQAARGCFSGAAKGYNKVVQPGCSSVLVGGSKLMGELTSDASSRRQQRHQQRQKALHDQVELAHHTNSPGSSAASSFQPRKQ